jgi:hypothetical protein
MRRPFKKSGMKEAGGGNTGGHLVDFSPELNRRLVKRRWNKEKPDPGKSGGKGACIKLSPKNCLQIMPVS